MKPRPAAMSEIWYNKSIILFFWEGNTMTSMNRLVCNRFRMYMPKSKLGNDIADPRRRPVVPIRHIISLLFCVPLAQKLSMLQLDQWARSERARSLFGSTRPIASDSTIQRMLPKIPLAATAHVLRSLLPSTVKQKTIDYPVAGRTIAQARRDRRIACGRPLAYGSCAHRSAALLSGRLSVNGGTRA